MWEVDFFFVFTVQNQDAKAAKQNMPPPKLKALKWHGDLKVKMRDIAETGSELAGRNRKPLLNRKFVFQSS